MTVESIFAAIIFGWVWLLWMWCLQRVGLFPRLDEPADPEQQRVPLEPMG